MFSLESSKKCIVFEVHTCYSQSDIFCSSKAWSLRPTVASLFPRQDPETWDRARASASAQRLSTALYHTRTVYELPWETSQLNP